MSRLTRIHASEKTEQSVFSATSVQKTAPQRHFIKAKKKERCNSFGIAPCFLQIQKVFSVIYSKVFGEPLHFTVLYANAVAGAGELIGRISIALIFTPLIGFNAVCYAAPAAWLLADIPLAIIYLKKKKKFKALAMRNMNTTADI